MNDEQLDQSEGEDVAGGVTFHASSTNHRPAFRVKCDAALPLKRSKYYYYYLEYFYLTAELFLQIHRRTRFKSKEDVLAHTELIV